MNILDIILLIFLLWAVYQGFKDGVVVQLAGLAGLFIGIYLAFRYSGTVAAWLHIDEKWATIAGFAIVLVLVFIAIAVIGRLLRGVCRFAGLAVLDKVGGIIVSVLKTGLILGLLLYGFGWLNDNQKWVKQEKLDRSVLYEPLIKVAETAFPYVDFVKDKLFSDND
jgi:membrane protein required for colicin V production